MSKKRSERGPKRAELLFKNLFGEVQDQESLSRVAEGLAGSHQNATRLLNDARLLVREGRLSSARFILTTAREEIAKSYILADSCKLDLEKHESVLMRLCQAFYDHVAKHAYLEVLGFPGVDSMAQARKIWDVEVKRWWPAGFEDGEPDMPHDTYFEREFPLYIDYGDYNQRWLIPCDSDHNAHFAGLIGDTPLARVEKLIAPWQQAQDQGLCTPAVLEALNSVFRTHYVGEQATRGELVSLYERVADLVEARTGTSRESFMASPLICWPLYRFVAEPY